MEYRCQRFTQEKLQKYELEEWTEEDDGENTSMAQKKGVDLREKWNQKKHGFECV